MQNNANKPPEPEGSAPPHERANLRNTIRKMQSAIDDVDSFQTPADDALVGKIGRVTAPVSPGKMGEVRLEVRGGSEDFLCVGAQPDHDFGVNSVVVVAAILPPRTLVVKSASG